MINRNLWRGAARCLSLAVGVSLSAAAQAGSWQQGVSAGGFSNVNIYTPDTVSAIGDGKALLIVLHGCSQPINNYLTANLEDAAEEYGMVVAVPDATNKAGFSCWSYWQGTKSRSAGDYKNLISLANTLSADSGRGIDPDQVYIAGLSSGASFANTTACLAPDVFAGMGISAGPSIGTSSNGALGPCEQADVTSRCNTYAGSYASHFDTQIASIAHGRDDTTVNLCYNEQNANGMAGVYGVSPLSGTNPIAEGSRTADEHLWQDGRVSMLWLNNVDHSWSGGEGASGGYISGNGINYARYLGQYFLDNNQRVDRNSGPEISNLSAAEATGLLAISGTALDAEGSVASVDITVSNIDTSTPQLVETLSVQASPADGYFSANTSSLADGLYQVEAIATDNEGVPGDPVSVTSRVGPEPPAVAPVLSDTAASVSGQCATVSGTVMDANQNLDSVVVAFASGDVTATVTGNSYSAEGCDLPGDKNTVTVTATDTTELSSQDSVSFNIDAGQTGDYNFHINRGHITWGEGYSACYLAFGTADFTMRETAAGGQCQWVADGDSSCAGPVQACANDDREDPTDSDSDGVEDAVDNCPNVANAGQQDNDGDGIGNACDSTPDGEVTCSEYTASNYSHVSAGRATTSGGYAYALGSGDNLGLYNIFVTTTLAETGTNYYQQGTCP
ncbi:PHB depolymerase family esterase [uncultured Microbulbifer sp.]|uniref:extracellular catalytic domain type 1 short-chain-length polyhydroxyalkanoate depolymerase n=1 Tax=uncultured Microbulbifer sp. TaxID=348147 RepID=UPI0025D9F92E|nr:PHB depolymerase family esterase [uncultured Microbulbifer sp.]